MSAVAGQSERGGLVAQEFQHRYVGRANCLRDLTERMPRLVRCLHRFAVLLHGGSAPSCGALRAGERGHLEERVGAGEKGVGLIHASLVLKAKRRVDEVVSKRDGVIGMLVNVLLGACVQRVCGGLLDLHAGNLRYRGEFVKAVFLVPDTHGRSLCSGNDKEAA